MALILKTGVEKINMKKYFICFFVLFAVGKSYAQDFDLGGKAGINYSASVIYNISGITNVDSISSQPGTGILFGVFARFTSGKISFQPELLFSQDKSSVTLNDIDVDDLQNISVNTVEIPIIFGYKALRTFRLEAGPVFNSVRATGNDALIDFNTMHVGYQAGVGFDLNRLTFDARYEGGSANKQAAISNGTNTVQYNTRKNVFQFTVGFKLFD